MVLLVPAARVEYWKVDADLAKICHEEVIYPSTGPWNLRLADAATPGVARNWLD